MEKIKIFSLISIICTFFYSDLCFSFSQKIDKELETTVQRLIDEHDIPGVIVGVWIPGKGEWVSALGFADKKIKEKMRLDDHFRIGSITKTFTITALLQLQDKGKLSLDDPIGKYIDNVPNGDKITLRQLANMTSGLPNYSENSEWNKEFLENPQRVWKPKELLKFAFNSPLDFNPGKKYEYSNTNTVLLGLVIEKVSGSSIASYLEENILKPLKLSNTSFPLDNKMPQPFAHGYSKDTLNKTEKDVSFNNPSWAFSAGQMVSNLHDLKIWGEALGTGKLLSKKAFEERLTPGYKSKKSPVEYCLGLARLNGWLLHTGELPGYNSIVAYLPKEKATLVILVNSEIAINYSKLHLKINQGTSDPVKLTYQNYFQPVILLFEEISKILFTNYIPHKG